MAAILSKWKLLHPTPTTFYAHILVCSLDSFLPPPLQVLFPLVPQLHNMYPCHSQAFFQFIVQVLLGGIVRSVQYSVLHISCVHAEMWTAWTIYSLSSLLLACDISLLCVQKSVWCCCVQLCIKYSCKATSSVKLIMSKKSPVFSFCYNSLPKLIVENNVLIQFSNVTCWFFIIIL